MRMDLPFSYMVTAKTSRWRNPKDVAQIGFVAWDIPEVSTDQAPVAMEWEHHFGDPAKTGYVAPRHARYCDGSFYVPFNRSEKEADHRVRVDPSELPKTDHKVAKTAYHFVDLFQYDHDRETLRESLEGWFKNSAENVDLTGAKDVEIFSSNESAERQLAEAIAERFLMVDGEVYLKVEEPKLAFDTIEHPFPYSQVSIVFTPDAYAPTLEHSPWCSPRYRTLFRADANAELEVLAAANGKPTRIQTARDIVVYMPQAFVFNDWADRVYRTAVFALTAAESHLGKIGRAGANAWHDIKDEISAFRNEGNVASLEDVLFAAAPTISDGLHHVEPGISETLNWCIDCCSTSEISLEFGTQIVTPK